MPNNQALSDVEQRVRKAGKNYERLRQLNEAEKAFWGWSAGGPMYARNTVALMPNVTDDRPVDRQLEEYYWYMTGHRQHTIALSVCEIVRVHQGLEGIKRLWGKKYTTTGAIKKLWDDCNRDEQLLLEKVRKL